MPPEAVKPKLGERVLLVPQAVSWLMNPHLVGVHVIGRPAHGVRAGGSRALDSNMTPQRWETFTSTLLRKGFGILVVRDGVLELGPSEWDSGD